MAFFSIVMKSVLGARIFNRIVNRYTAHGIIILIIQLESLGVLPTGTWQVVDGLPATQIGIWLTVAVGIYFVFHAPKFKSRLEKKQMELDILKKELELIQTKKVIEQEKNKPNIISTINNSKTENC